jgi:hypothetical protein
MDNFDKYLLEWEEKFNLYCELELKCITNIALINELKVNLKKYLGNQKKDDLLFYNSIIENSYFYLQNSLKIRQIKFCKDLNWIWQQVNDKKSMDEVNKINFMSLLKDFKKIIDDIILAKRNNTILTWVKDDKIESVEQIQHDMEEIMDYHLKLMQFFYSNVELEKVFYCGK